MKKLCRFWLFAGAVMSHSHAYAIDPFTLLATGNATVNLISSIGGASKGALEAGELISALNELATETLPEPQDPSDPYRLARKIERVEAAALEAGYTREEVDAILNGYRESNSNLASNVRLLSRSVRLGKRLVKLAGLSSDKAAKAATIAQAQSSNQDRKLLSDIYGQLVTESLEQKSEKIEKARAQQGQYRKLRETVLSMAQGKGIGFFQIDHDLIRKALEVYRSCAPWVLSLVALIFTGRIVYYQFSLAAAEMYLGLIQETVLCYFLMLALPLAVSYMSEISGALSAKMSDVLHVTGAALPEKMAMDSSIWWWLSPEMIPLILYVIMNVGFNLILAVLVAVGPIAVLFGTMLDFTLSLASYFTFLLIACFWPLVWNVLGYFKNLLWAQSGLSMSGVGSAVVSVIFFLLQVLSPFVALVLLRQAPGGSVLTGAARAARQGYGSQRSNFREQEREA